MKCKKAEHKIQRSFDGLLPPSEKKELGDHLAICLSCQNKYEEYSFIFNTLKDDRQAESRPFFWERLQPRLKEPMKPGPLSIWKQFGLRAIPLALVFIVFLAATAFFLFPEKETELSQSGILLRNQNPFQDTLPALAAKEGENPNMMLIFTAMDDKSSYRRYFP